MDEKLREEIKAAVAIIFSEKEEADIRRKTEDALQRSAETIQELTTSLEAKNEELEQRDEKLTGSEEKSQSLQAELEAATQEVESVTGKLAEAEKALKEVEKDRAAEKRIIELNEAKVSDSDEASQTEKVREMTEEDFRAYKDERIALREAVIAEIEAAKEENDIEPDPKKNESTEGKTGDKEEGSEEQEEASEEEGEEEDTPLANIDPGQAVSAALNMEVIPSKDVVSKYAELGKAMAELMTNKK